MLNAYELGNLLSMPVSWDAGSLCPTVTTGAVSTASNDGAVGNSTSSYWINPPWHDVYQHFYPAYPHPIYVESKIDQAFKVAKILQDKKLINVKTVKQFLDLIDELVKVL